MPSAIYEQVATEKTGQKYSLFFRTNRAFFPDAAAAGADAAAATGGAMAKAGAVVVDASGTSMGAMCGVAVDNSLRRRSKSATASSGVGGLTRVVSELLIVAAAALSLAVSSGLDIIMVRDCFVRENSEACVGCRIKNSLSVSSDRETTKAREIDTTML
jgi:hypothetical protein